MRHLSVLSVFTREKIPTPTRSYASWNWTTRPNEGSWLSTLTLLRCVCVCVSVWLEGHGQSYESEDVIYTVPLS